MPRKFRGCRRDANEPEIVAVCERAGRLVEKVDSIVGFPDLVIVKRGSRCPVYVVSSPAEMRAVLQRDDPVALVEVKTPKGKLEPLQVDWIADACFDKWNPSA